MGCARKDAEAQFDHLPALRALLDATRRCRRYGLRAARRCALRRGATRKLELCEAV